MQVTFNCDKKMVKGRLFLENRQILFVTPPCRSGVVDVFGRWLPLGFVYLAAAARMAGLDAGIYDAMSKGHGYPEIEQQFRNSAAPYIAVSAITSSIGDAVRTLELAKRVNPQVVTILGGVHPTFCWQELLSSSSAVDYIICGEGEATIRELLQTLEAGANPDSVAGLAFRRDGAIIKTPLRLFTGSLDDLPTAWDLLDWQDYPYFVIADSRLGAISTSRAGENDSILSSLQNAGGEARRFRTPHKVVAEIVHLYECYGVNVFLITDDCPTALREHWELFLDLMIERNLPLYLLMQSSSADIVRDREIIWKYRKAGVVQMYVDMTAGNMALSDPGGSGPEDAEGRLALEMIHEQGIVSEASFVIGGPDETKKGVEQTLELARYYNPDNAQFLPLTPWPYDRRFDAVRQFVKVHDYGKYNLIDPVIEPKSMSLLQVDVALVDCYRRFYMGKMLEIITQKDLFKRDYLLKAMKLMMVSPFIVRKMGLGTLARVPARIGEMMRKEVF